MERRRYLAWVGAGAAVGAAGCLAIPGVGNEEFDIGMSANAFRPDAYTATAGEPVIWENDGSRAHTVTAYDRGVPDGAAFFASGGFADESTARAAWTREEGGIIHPGERYEHRFEVAGRYYYFCVPHEPGGMVAELVVEE